MRTVSYEGISSFDLPPGFYVSGGDAMAAYDNYREPGRCENRCVFCLESRFVPGIGDAQLPAGNRRPRVDLCSWEPTALDDLPGTVKALRRRYAAAAVFTNGRRLDADLSRRLAEAGASEVVISLHGPNARIHDALTRACGSFAEAVAGARALAAAAAGGRPRLGVSAVLTRSNLPHLGALLDLSVSLGARALHLSLMVPLGPAARAVKKHGPGAVEAFAAFAALARERGGTAPIPVHLLHFPLCVASRAAAPEVAAVRAPRRGDFEELLAPEWAGRCAACRWAPWCEGMMAVYAPNV